MKRREEFRIPDTARCPQCKRQFDLPTLRECPSYIPGVCPICGGYLKSVYGR